MIAVGAYLQARRKAEGLTQEEIARRLKMTSRTVSEWETGGTLPAFEVMVRLLDIIKGQIEVVQDLYLRTNATAEQGRALAERTLTEMRSAATEDARRQVLDRLIAELESDPRKIDQLIGYGARLRDEDRAGH